MDQSTVPVRSLWRNLIKHQAVHKHLTTGISRFKRKNLTGSLEDTCWIDVRHEKVTETGSTVGTHTECLVCWPSSGQELNIYSNFNVI
jgi:hypothetical protein